MPEHRPPCCQIPYFILTFTLPVLGGARAGWLGVLLAQPAALTVPVAFAVMIVVSRLTAVRVLVDIGRIMVALHAPESLGVHRRTT